MHSSLKSYAPAERPRERCLNSGPGCLSLRECLALILGSGPPGVGCLGLASRLLESASKGLSPGEEEIAFFSSMEVSEKHFVQNIQGLGPAGQTRILAAFELGRRYTYYRCNRSQDQSGVPVRQALIRRKAQKENAEENTLKDDALARISAKERAQPQEWLGFVPIHRTGKIGDFCVVEKGARTHINVDPSELFARILAVRPRGFVLFHNHPSGIPYPSPQDFDLTERVHEIASQLGIVLAGHWIVTAQSEYWIENREHRNP